MLRIISSRAYCGKTTYITNEIIKNINQGISSYLMVPEQLTLETEKMLLELSDKPLFLCKVMSFERLSAHILSIVGGTKKEYIDDIAKIMLTENILIENKEDFIIYKNSINKTGFIENIVKTISELKKYDINIKNFLNLSNIVTDKLLAQKIKEISKIYELIEEKTYGKFSDNESRLNLLCEKIEDYIKKKEFKIYFDNFISFTSLELNVIEKLLQFNVDVSISLLYEDCNDSSFYITNKTLKSLIDIALKVNSKYEIVKLDKSYSLIEDLRHLEKNFGKQNYEKYDKNQENIKIIKCDTSRDEIIRISKEITKLVREDNYRYKDIAVVITESINYPKHIKEIFDIYDIPYFIDAKKSATQENIVKLIFSFLDMFVSSPNYSNVMSFFKSGMTDIKKEEYEIFENYLINWNIDTKKYISEKFFEKDDYFKENFEEDKEIILKVRYYVKDIYDRYKSKFTAKKTQENKVKLYSNAISEFLRELDCKQKLENLVEQLKEKLKYELAGEISQIWNLILETLDKIDTVLDEYSIDIATYKKMLYQGISTQKIAVIPSTIDTVLVMDIQRSKSLGYKALFMVGMNDTLLPRTFEKDIIFSDTDKNIFMDYNINLSSTSDNILYQEKTALYSIISKARQKIYFSYPIEDVNSQSAGKSPYISIIENIFPNINTIVDKNYENKYKTLKEVFNNLKEDIILENGKYSDETLKLYKYFSQKEEYNKRLKSLTKAMFVKNNIAKINQVSEIYNLPLRTSVSQIQNYIKCPFSHYINYALRPQKRKRQVIDNINSGNILHKYMEKFSKEILENKEILSIDSKEDIENIVDKIYNEEDFLDNNMKNLSVDSNRQKNIIKRLKKISCKMTDIIIKQQHCSSFNITSYEKKIDDIEIKLDRKDTPKDKIILRGYIDRVDELKKDNKTYIGVVDYKSSAKKLELKDIYQGINIQMIFYLYALTKMQEDKEPYYAMYFPMIDTKLHLSDEDINDYENIQEKLKEKMKMAGIITDDLNLIRAFENDISGNSKFMEVSLKTKKAEAESVSGKSVVSENDMKLIINHIIKVIKDSANEILSGNICPNPIEDSCKYCTYNNICAFDESIKGYEYKKIENLTKKEVIEKLASR